LALSEPHRPVLIHGPPGTGKTSVIAALVSALVSAGKRVLLAAGTNTAVDNIVELLWRRDVDFLRLGTLEPHSALNRLASRAELSRHIEREHARKETSLDAIAHRLKTVPVVAGTAHRIIRSPAIAAIQRLTGGVAKGAEPLFDVAIIDEATQLTEPLTLGVVLWAHRFVLVGDNRQLPPVVTSDEARSAAVRPHLEPRLQAMGLGGSTDALRSPWPRTEAAPGAHRMSTRQALSNCCNTAAVSPHTKITKHGARL
jgi:DNA replication ATP-dependent helicase Dna2